jgi:hypothetical protein
MATEKRLIDADAFRQSLELDRFGYTNIVKVNIALDKSTVDAVHVVHGKWELRNVTSGINGRYWCCTACGCIRSYWEYEPDDNYCFKCGAKMDGGNEDG